MMLEVSVNGRRIEASSGQTVLEAARDHGIEIPTLCYHPDLSLEGSCRLCLVEVDGISHEMVACCLKVEPGMVVRTETPRLHQARKDVLEMLLSRYHDAGYAPGDGEKTEFQHWVRRYGAKSPTDDPPRYPVNADPNPFVWVDLNKCILCTRCVRACAEVQGRFVWGVAGRGDHSRIVAGADSDMLSARCESCGACVAYCPTGALDDKPSVGRGR
ncbi:MAG TPA: 2Fe-2S iron-sulfur cluster-binding protein, partial [Burkholderiales bacterium]|nr:2Fe-2S iron-sulfur cluster-binding protein [Burkholderiales bacterium]